MHDRVFSQVYLLANISICVKKHYEPRLVNKTISIYYYHYIFTVQFIYYV